ncbi:MAG: hypothetical protein VKK42_25265 [Lyngbya sp.]|nr:hypothetical protein [Lyngbya sp.]
MNSQTFLGRITTFFMSVLLFSTFFFPLMSQPAWANQPTTTVVRNSAQPLCTAESRVLGKSECNVNIDDRHITYNNDSHDTYNNDSHDTYNNSASPEVLLGGAALGAITGGAASVMAVSSAGSVAGLSAAGISSGLAAVGGVVGGGMAAGLAVSAALPVVATVGVGLAAYQGVKVLTSSHHKRKVDQSQQ